MRTPTTLTAHSTRSLARVIAIPAAMLIALALLPACSSIGPGTVARDRFEYSSAIGESWKRQTLLNIVKMRYVESPIFVDVGQIVASYSLESGVQAGTEIDPTESNDDLAVLMGHATYTDRPTVTYTPLTGNRFVKALMTPLPPASVLFVIESGWPADAVMLMGVSSLNGLQNQRSTIGGTTAPDADFLRAIGLMRTVQLAGGMSLRIEEDEQKKQSAMIRILPNHVVSADARQAAAELGRLLGLAPEANELRVRFGRTAGDSGDLAMTTRSILQLMSTMAAQIEVPGEDLSEHRVPPGLESVAAGVAAGVDGDGRDGARMISIRCTKESPRDAFAAVEYRRHWFWIDDRDLQSKRVFAFMMMLFTLAETGERDPLPLITIPTR